MDYDIRMAALDKALLLCRDDDTASSVVASARIFEEYLRGEQG